MSPDKSQIISKFKLEHDLLRKAQSARESIWWITSFDLKLL